jgi:hypothetical protein
VDVGVEGVTAAELVGGDVGEDRRRPGRVLEHGAGLDGELPGDRDLGRVWRREHLEHYRARAVLLLPLEAAAHPQQIVERDLAARITVRLPFLDGRRRVELASTVADQHPDDGRREALGDRPRRRRLIRGVERVVPLVDDLTFFDDDNRTDTSVGVIRAERGGNGGVELRRVDTFGQVTDRQLERRVRNVRRLGGIGGRLVGDRQRR